MKQAIALLLLCVLLAGCTPSPSVPETTAAPPPPETTITPTEPSTAPTTVPTEPATVPTTQETTVATEPPIVLELTQEEQDMLKKLAMAEVGYDYCQDCLSLVMCTVLNRVSSENFGSTIRNVIYAQDQFTPVSDGTFDEAVPNERCQRALDQVMRGWDESQGALYYEFGDTPSQWHSQNLELLFQHCRTRFYK